MNSKAASGKETIGPWIGLVLRAAVNPAVARGKKVLYVHNDTKLEKARAADPADPKRIASMREAINRECLRLDVAPQHAAVVALLANQRPNPSPTLVNTCYSMVSEKLAVHVASVHKYDLNERTMKAVPGSGGVSAAMNELEGSYAMNWARNIWADALS